MSLAISLDNVFRFIKVFIIIICTYFSTEKIMNQNNSGKMRKYIILMPNIVIAYLYYFFRNKIGIIYNMILLIALLTILISKVTKKTITFSFACTTISLTINYILYIISTIITYVPCNMLQVTQDYIISILINLIYTCLIYLFFKIKKIKNGFDFLNSNFDSGYFKILFFNISIIILFTVVILKSAKGKVIGEMGAYLIIFTIIMVSTIKKSFNLHYKQKLLSKELEETKVELSKKEKEVADLEAENIAISKKSHTLAHKQKALEYKLEEIINKTEISKDEVGEVRDRIKVIEKDLYKEKTAIELDKTEIPQIDDMLKYMQSECKKNKIDFELQVKGNIHYMTNNLITKEDLETLLADHIKNAIIAINHTDNVNRSIFVRLGDIDGIYSLYIYDTGIEFEKETLENLGKKPSTTHKDEGGTGMGFMNTFDTLRKCKASLIIEQIGKPSKENYTKAIIIKFDKKNQFKIM